MSHPLLRPATTADVQALLGFWLEAGENDSRPADSADAVRRQLERDPEALVVAELDGRIVGSVIAGWDGWRAHVYRLAVHPDARRRGLGRLLLEHVEARFTALGATRVDAMVLEGNALGQAIWAAAGYAPQDDWRRWVKPLR
ncbi:GNAT family N-acetyltransferase [Nocardioides sp.]|uniref:GNAT family N-acetyltransferase n=1 Tax=Nocardioides sp. TaxID=35761 RepID=UPI00271ABDF1|nr:GNAT family N-acetyltransferase [Nocardioides sp.]MDO9456436.1 GNAT family N-acetyltransferase [Nocardioides sp.]